MGGVTMWVVIGLIGGFGLWTLEEYLAHRFLFHHPSRWLGQRHLAHHQDTRQVALTFARWQVVAAAIVAEGALFMFAFSLPMAIGLTLGLLAGYAHYEWTHYSDHFRIPTSKRAKRLRQHHLIHHFRDSRRAFGVTTTFWDRVFGTLPPAAKPPRAERAEVETSPPPA